MAYDRTRRPSGPLQTAEAAFKKATTKPAEQPPTIPTLPGTRTLVSLRIEQEVLDYFQAGGPGWEGRINDVLKAAAGK